MEQAGERLTNSWHDAEYVSRGISDIQERCSSVPKQSIMEVCSVGLSSRCVERRGNVGQAPVYLQGREGVIGTRYPCEYLQKCAGV